MAKLTAAWVIANSSAARVKLARRPAASNTISAPGDGSRERRLCTSSPYLKANEFEIRGGFPAVSHW
jgi:hypothetical protein